MVLLGSIGLKQHVIIPTHNSEHTLNMLLTRQSGPRSDEDGHDDFISDHSPVLFKLILAKLLASTTERNQRVETKIN